MISFLKKKIIGQPVFISLIVVIIGVVAYLPGIPFLDQLELKTIDLRFQARGEMPAGSEIVLAVIDEKSIANEGKWVWPRTKFVTLINRLSDAGARVIGFDVGFLDPDNRQVVETIADIRNAADSFKINSKPFFKYLEQVKAESDYDQLLAESATASKARIVLGYFFHMDSQEAGHVDKTDIEQHGYNVRGSQHKIVRYISREAQSVPLQQAYMPQSNIKQISDITDYSGFFNMFPDDDGVVRWIPAVIKFQDSLYAPLSLKTLSAYLDEPLAVTINELGVDSVKVGDMVVPTNEQGHIMINYRGPAKTYDHISITDILQGDIEPKKVKDKIVLVGATAVAVYDMRVTPFGSVFPGLEIHANMIDSILHKQFLQHPNWSIIFDLIAIIVPALLLGLLVSRISVIYGGLFWIIAFAGHILTCNYLFSHHGWVLNMVYPASVIIVVYVSITAYRFLVESRQKTFIKDAFSTYLAPSVVKNLLDSPDKLVLGGEKRPITAFFSDVQGFTSISEKLSPEKLVELLNEFLTEMTDIILAHKGTVDKFEGDAIIAMFGAPNDVPEQEITACKACIAMQNRLTDLRRKWRSENKPELHMRIGLYTGPAVVGNMGSKNRMDYTMMGDTVNIAARLEGVNKQYGIFSLIGETTFWALDDSFLTREIDAIKVVGKSVPVSIYELIGYASNTTEKQIEAITRYTAGLAAYRNQDWKRAVHFFKAALDLSPGDNPSQTMIQRCAYFHKKPPESGWDGAFSMTKK